MPDAHEGRIVVFLSAVSSEFHKEDRVRDADFISYREALNRELRRMGPFVVIDQECIDQGFGDLLGCLDAEVARAHLIVHLVGDMAGVSPSADEVGVMLHRHGGAFLGPRRTLRERIGDGAGISYTQWEVYLGFHHDRARLEFEATADAPRSPFCAPTAEDRASQAAHIGRLHATGERPRPFIGHRDLFGQVVVNLTRHGWLIANPALTTSAAAEAEARTRLPEITRQIAEKMKQPDPRTVPTPARASVLSAALGVVAEAHGLTEQSLVALIDEHRRHMEEKAAAPADAPPDARPDAGTLRELALARTAVADYAGAMLAARQAADAALAEMHACVMPVMHPHYREQALNALLLFAEAARHAGLREAALAATEEGGTYIDRTQEPVFWAEYHRALAYELIDAGHYHRAEPFVRQVRDIADEHPGGQNDLLIRSVLLLGTLLSRQGNAAGAEVAVQRALRLAEAQVPQDMALISLCCNNLGLAYLDEGRHAEAEELLRLATGCDHQLFGPDDSGTLSSRCNLASAIDLQGRHAEAEAEHRVVLAARERVLGPEHPATLTTRNNLALAIDRQGRHAEAEVEHRAMLAAHESALGPEHPATLAARNNLALAINSQGRHAEAEAEHRVVLAAQERVLGPEHPATLTTRNNLACAIDGQGRHAEAEVEHRAVLAAREHVLGAEHPDTLVTRHNLGGVINDLGRHEEAEGLLRSVLEQREPAAGPDHPDTLYTCRLLAACLADQDRHAEALPLARRAHEGLSTALGPEHAATVKAGETHGRIKRAMGNP